MSFSAKVMLGESSKDDVSVTLGTVALRECPTRASELRALEKC
jgi:hypothetical protein